LKIFAENNEEYDNYDNIGQPMEVTDE